MKKATLAIICVLFLCASVASATDWYVSTTGSNTNGGTSWLDAWRNIQYAVSHGSVVSGDVINVAAGTYNENVNITKGLTLKGANAGVPGTVSRGAESIVDADDPDQATWAAAFYVNSGDVTIDGFKTIDADEGIHVACWGG